MDLLISTLSNFPGLWQMAGRNVVNVGNQFDKLHLFFKSLLNGIFIQDELECVYYVTYLLMFNTPKNINKFH